MNADSPQEPSVPPVPPGQPQMVPPPRPGPPPPPPMNPQYPMAPPQHPGLQPMLPPPPPSDRPSPLGLIVAGAGLALLCVSMLLPRIKIEDDDGEMGMYSFSMFSGAGTGGFGMDTPTVVLSIALLAAVGMSAHRSPALRWPSRLGAIGTAALLAAYAYHPVTVMRQTLDAYATDDGYTDEDSGSTSAEDIDITADSGVYLVLLAAILLALSCFLMQTNPRGNQSFLSYQEMQPPPGNNPTVTVNPG